MHAIRAFFLRHRAVALAVVALALALKALVPTGYMIGGDAGTVTVLICDGYTDGDHDAVHAVAVAVKGHGDAGKAGHDQQVCPFSALSHAGLTGADPILLAAALVYILLLGLAASIFTAPRPFARLRPPLRAPPSRV